MPAVYDEECTSHEIINRLKKELYWGLTSLKHDSKEVCTLTTTVAKLRSWYFKRNG